MNSTLVFIDAGFLSKLSKHLGNGKYLKFDLIRFSKFLGRKKNLFVEKIFYYVAPPYQSNKPSEDQVKRKKGYDKFIFILNKDKLVQVREGRVQRIFDENGKEDFRQKGVDSLFVADLVSVPIRYPEVKEVILVTSDTDFCPIIKYVQDFGIKVVVYSYSERKRNSKFSVSNHLIDCCDDIEYLKKEDLEKFKF